MALTERLERLGFPAQYFELVHQHLFHEDFEVPHSIKVLGDGFVQGLQYLCLLLDFSLIVLDLVVLHLENLFDFLRQIAGVLPLVLVVLALELEGMDFVPHNFQVVLLLLNLGFELGNLLQLQGDLFALEVNRVIVSGLLHFLFGARWKELPHSARNFILTVGFLDNLLNAFELRTSLLEFCLDSQELDLELTLSDQLLVTLDGGLSLKGEYLLFLEINDGPEIVFELLLVINVFGSRTGIVHLKDLIEKQEEVLLQKLLGLLGFGEYLGAEFTVLFCLFD